MMVRKVISKITKTQKSYITSWQILKTLLKII